MYRRRSFGSDLPIKLNGCSWVAGDLELPGMMLVDRGIVDVLTADCFWEQGEHFQAGWCVSMDKGE